MNIPRADWKNNVVSPDTSIRETIERIDASEFKIALVIDEKEQLLGSVTDGDIRRGLMQYGDLQVAVSKIMNGSPVVAYATDPNEALLRKMKTLVIHQIPIVDTNNKLVGIKNLDSLITPDTRDNMVLLMAGGLGSRLKHYTKDCPKPLLKVGSKPLLETILEKFIDFGFSNFLISVNYKKEMLKSYFQSGEKWSVSIDYLEENEQLGTAGALSLIKSHPDKPFIVMNADLLTKVNFSDLLSFHEENNSEATMCVREYETQVPYGVIDIENEKIARITEKPVKKYFVNAGIYVLNPSVLDHLKPNQYINMPQLFEKVIASGGNTGAYPIHEYWIDIGHIDNLVQADNEFEDHFG